MKLREMKNVVEKLSCKYDDWNLRLTLYKLAIFDGKEKSLKMNFWIPENTPEYKERAKLVLC